MREGCDEGGGLVGTSGDGGQPCVGRPLITLWPHCSFKAFLHKPLPHLLPVRLSEKLKNDTLQRKELLLESEQMVCSWW